VSHRLLTRVEKLHINGVALLGRGTDGEMISEYRSLPTTWPKLEHKNKIVHVLEDGKPSGKHRRHKLKNTKYYFHKWVAAHASRLLRTDRSINYRFIVGIDARVLAPKVVITNHDY